MKLYLEQCPFQGEFERLILLHQEVMKLHHVSAASGRLQ